MTRKLKWSLALALLLVLAAAVALAITLNQSASYTATQRARQALMDKYDLTVEMLPLFDEQLTD